eukprot:TRINITY_DN8831_c0_g2_i1.p1 TRINITY_DN8831_c0_g2~~TRINITY_DN8831_c0_g2_i1.p1  ORF type:complete len:659 (+),score=167.74 TRINITY_DN8831_c0_g2_i1:168-2144(+)
MQCVPSKLDRWMLNYTMQSGASLASSGDNIPVSDSLPLNVVNNYFSFGSDAFATLNFHLARERDPAKFKSRFGNKGYYAMQGAKDIFLHRYRDLCETIQLQCDGEDVTERIRSRGLEAIAFLNIPSYCAGTRPWGTKSAVDGFEPQRMDDGLLEVVGFQSALSLAKGVMRIGHAYRIAQCKAAVITFGAATAVQVDGEPCMLAPGKVDISFKNQATLLCRPKGRFGRDLQAGVLEPAFPVSVSVEDGEDSDDTGPTSPPRALPERHNTLQQAMKRAPKAVADTPKLDESVVEDETEVAATIQASRLSRQGSLIETPADSGRLTVVPGHADKRDNDAKPPVVPPPASTPTRPSATRISVQPATDQQPDTNVRTLEATKTKTATSHSSTPARNVGALEPDDVPVALFLVPLDSCSIKSRNPIYMGRLSLNRQQTLMQQRLKLSEYLKVIFSRKRGWRFLEYVSGDQAEDQGTYISVNKAREQSLSLDALTSSEGELRRLEICNKSEPAQLLAMLFEAIMEGDLLMVRELSSDTDLVSGQDLLGTNAIHVCARENRMETLLFLHEECEASLDVTDLAGRTPLMYAAEEGHVDMCKVLLDYHCNAAARDRAGYRADELATLAGHDDVAELLRLRKCSVMWKACIESRSIVAVGANRHDDSFV